MPHDDLTQGRSLHGFTVRKISPLPDLNSTLVQLEHEGTGARYLHVANPDDNNLFAVGFRTPPLDSTGAPHILEHTVLCGSRKYPVHDPFFSMLRRSLSTFMNAMTADDWTLYPFSTQNRTDFYNLMGVYLDAAFFPLLRERDFRQEGHRLEFSDPNDPSSSLVIQGVVYNEMKGHMSDPYSLLGTRTAEALYPTTPYSRNAGGEPRHIPDLTWEDLRAFHAACYHPSNAYFFSYGDLPLEPHLAFVQKEVLGGFRRIDPKTSVGMEKRFREPRRSTVGFPLDPGEPTAGRSMVQLAWLTCPITDLRDTLGLDLLSELLLGNPAAPLHKALLDSKLGANLAPGSGFADENRETHFAAGLQGTEPDRAGAIEDLVLTTLERVRRDGFAPDRIDAAIQQVEFSHREVRGDHYPYGLSLLSRLMGPWIHGADPAEVLDLGKWLGEIRAARARGDYFEQLLSRQLLDNPHRVTLTLRPDPEMGPREQAAEQQRVRARDDAMGEAERARLVELARELREAQEAEEDVSVLPTLEISDIPRGEREVPWTTAEHEGVPVVRFSQPTNGIGYVDTQFDADALGEDLVPLLPLFCATLPLVGAAGASYTEMAERIAAATGGVRAGITFLEDPERSGAFRTVVEVTGKALRGNQSRLGAILRDLLAAPDFQDRERLHTILNQLRVNLENSLPAMGHRYAARAAAASLTPSARLKERWSGIEHLRFVRAVAGRDPADLGDVSAALQAISERLPSRAGTQCAVAADDKLLPEMRDALAPIVGALRAAPVPGAAGSADDFRAQPIRLGLAASVPVSFVARVFPCVSFTHPDTGGLLVLAKLLKAGYLHREIRERGGAYGGMAGYAPESGLFSLLSYRDPHLSRTVRVFDDAARWASEGGFDDREIKEAVLGVFSDLDTPLSPSGKAAREFGYLRQGLTRTMRQNLREQILATDRRRLRDLAERHLVAGRARSSLGVVSNEEALKRANGELGEDALELQRV